MSDGYQSYLNVLANNREEVRRDRDEPPSACPDCGEPLQSGPTSDSRLFCPFDGWHDYVMRGTP